MRYEGSIYRPPSEAGSYILQATIGCSWNRCTYCDMYRAKSFRVRELDEVLEDVREAGRAYGKRVDKVFVAAGDALVMDLDTWLPILDACRDAFPSLRQISCYAMATNVNEKTPEELRTLREHGLDLLYVGPETGDPVTMKRIVKGSTPDEHVDAARRAREAGMRLSVIFLLGAGGIERSEEHARASAELATAMDPEYLAALTLTVIPGTPIARLEDTDRFEMPGVAALLTELRHFVEGANPTNALFRTNHASNYLPIGGRLPADRDLILEAIDQALEGRRPLRRPEHRGL